jgi:hypothetical protein
LLLTSPTASEGSAAAPAADADGGALGGVLAGADAPAADDEGLGGAEEWALPADDCAVAVAVAATADNVLEGARDEDLAERLADEAGLE